MRIKKNVYSVNLMFAYINIFKPEITKIKLDIINYNIYTKGWGEGNISVNDVLHLFSFKTPIFILYFL